MWWLDFKAVGDDGRLLDRLIQRNYGLKHDSQLAVEMRQRGGMLQSVSFVRSCGYETTGGHNLPLDRCSWVDLISSADADPTREDFEKAGLCVCV